MANDDWRITIEVEEEHAPGFFDRLTGDLGTEARELANDLKAHRLAVSRDDDTIYVYAATRAAAEQAHAVVEAELREHGIEARTSRVEHWLDEEDRWDDEPPGETWEQEELDRGFAPWEVRVECASHQAARELAEQLEAEGYKPSGAPSTSSSAPRAARTPTRWRPACTARSSRAASSSTRSSRPIRSPSSAAWACSWLERSR